MLTQLKVMSDTSDNNKSVTDENSNGQNAQLGNQNPGGSNNITSDNGNVNAGTKPVMPKVIDNEQQEDYAAYVERQKKTYDAMDREEQQESTVWRIFDESASKNAEREKGMEREVLESKFREKLASSGFEEHDIDVMIKDMENDGFVERVATELDEVIYDILRKK